MTNLDLLATLSLNAPHHGVGELGLRLLGRRSQQPVAQRWGMSGKGSDQWKTEKGFPPHLDSGHPEHRSALPLHSIPSLPLENTTTSAEVAHSAASESKKSCCPYEY